MRSTERYFNYLCSCSLTCTHTCTHGCKIHTYYMLMCWYIYVHTYICTKYIHTCPHICIVHAYICITLLYCIVMVFYVAVDKTFKYNGADVKQHRKESEDHFRFGSSYWAHGLDLTNYKILLDKISAHLKKIISWDLSIPVLWWVPHDVYVWTLLAQVTKLWAFDFERSVLLNLLYDDMPRWKFEYLSNTFFKGISEEFWILNLFYEI